MHNRKYILVPLLAVTLWAPAALAQTPPPPPPFEIHTLPSVTHSFQTIGLSQAAKDNGVILAQTTSYKGNDAGTIRINSSFQARYQESHNGNHTTSDEVNVVAFMQRLPSMGVPGESGTFTMSTSSSNQMYTLEFLGEYANPVVLLQAATYNGSDPIAVYPMFTAPRHAVIAMAEGSRYDNSHATETIHYVVIEAGVYQLPGGAYLEAGLVDMTTSSYSGSGFTQITPTNYGYYQDAAIIAQPQFATGPAAGPAYAGTRIKRNIDADGYMRSFSVRHMLDDDVESSSPASMTSWVGYLIMAGSQAVVTTGAAGSSESYSWVEGASVDDEWNQYLADSIDSICGENEIEEWLEETGGDWGNNTFGASYSGQVGLSDQSSAGYDLWVGGTANADVTVFGHDITVVDVGAEATAEDGSQSNRGWLEVLGVTIYDQSISVGVAWDKTQTFVQVSATFYGVTVTGKALGSVGLDGSASAGATGISVNATPYASLSAQASASVGVWCASAGVSGTLTLLQIDLPVDGNVQFLAGYNSWGFDASAVLSTLSGSFDLDISWCLGSDSYELFSWTGLSKTIPLISGSGCL